MNWLKSIVPIGLIMILVSAMAPVHEIEKDAAKGIGFYSGSFSEAIALAKKENKLIFLDIYASWCGPCKTLKSKTFTDATVGEFYNSNFINFEVDAEKGEGVNLAEKYNIIGYPTLLFVDSHGKIVAKTMGYHNPDEFLKLGQTIIKEYR